MSEDNFRTKGRDDAIICGWILRHLYNNFPNSVEELDLEVAVRGTCRYLRPGAFDGHLVYLEEKGYIAWHTDVVLKDEMRIVRLTAAGRDLLADGAASEPYINVTAPAARPPVPLPKGKD